MKKHPTKMVACILVMVMTVCLAVTPAFADNTSEENHIEGMNKTIATGDRASYAFDEFGFIYAWGSNDKGQLANYGAANGNGYIVEPGEEPPRDPITKESLEKAKYQTFPLMMPFISIGDGLSKLFDNGASISYDLIDSKGYCLYLWGEYYRDKKTHVLTNPGRVVSESQVGGIADFVDGGGYYLLLNKQGQLYTWGDSTDWQTGTFTEELMLSLKGKTFDEDLPCKILDNIKAIAAKDGIAYAVSTEGKVYEFGSSPTLTVINNHPNKAFGAGNLAHASVYDPIESYVRQYSNENLSYEQQDEIKQDNLRTNSINGKVVDIATNGRTTLALTEGGQLWGWGDNTNGELGNHATNISNTLSWQNFEQKPVVIGAPVLVCENVKDFAIGKSNTYAVLKDGTLVGFGANNYGQLATGSMDTERHDKTVITTSVKEVSASRYHVILRKTDDSVWGFGENFYGEVSGDELEKGNVVVLTPVKINLTGA